MLALAQAEAEAQKATDAAAQAPKDGEGDIGAALYTEEAALDRGESVSALTTSSLQAQKPPLAPSHPQQPQQPPYRWSSEDMQQLLQQTQVSCE